VRHTLYVVANGTKHSIWCAPNMLKVGHEISQTHWKTLSAQSHAWETLCTTSA